MPPDEPTLDGADVSLAIIVARFNQHITSRLLSGAQEAIERHRVASHDVFWVPGSFELPVAALHAADSDNYDAIVCLGAVIRHETDHYQHISTQVAAGIQQVAIETAIPCHFGVLTCDNEEQALARSGSDGNVGREAVEAAIQTILTLRTINPD